MSEEHENVTSAPHAVDDGGHAAAADPKATVPPVMVLGFVIVLLLVALLVVNLRGRAGSGFTGADVTELQAEANALRSQLNRERLALGLRPLEGGDSEAIEDISGRLKKDAGSLQSLLAEKETQLSAKDAEMLRSEEQRMGLAAEAQRLRAQLQQALVSGSEVDMLRRDLETMKSQRDALSSEVATLRAQTTQAGGSAEEFAELERRLEEAMNAKAFFESRANDLEAQLSKARLFASSETELLPAAVELFRSLRKLEGHPDSDLTSAYSSLGVELGANVRHTFQFATGSSQLTPADEERIRRMVDEIPDGDMVLAIGYASETGNVDSNRTLSSDRATAVAELFSSVKRPQQLAQAVYLGQTDRFSSRIPERNQLVEVWQIRKK
jgi:outer membrane protein OmpA-like peptidoglycan-associated protein